MNVKLTAAQTAVIKAAADRTDGNADESRSGRRR